MTSCNLKQNWILCPSVPKQLLFYLHLYTPLHYLHDVIQKFYLKLNSTHSYFWGSSIGVLYFDHTSHAIHKWTSSFLILENLFPPQMGKNQKRNVYWLIGLIVSRSETTSVTFQSKCDWRVTTVNTVQGLSCVHSY